MTSLAKAMKQLSLSRNRKPVAAAFFLVAGSNRDNHAVRQQAQTVGQGLALV
jgi:hypothetical protein